MKTFVLVVAALGVGVVIGSVSGGRLRAQQPSTAYYVENNEISDNDCYFKECVPLARASLQAAHARYVAAGKPVEFDAPSVHDRGTVIAFDSMDQLRAWHEGAQYRQARTVGDRCAKFHTFALPAAP